MDYDELIKMREEAGADPFHNISFSERAYKRGRAAEPGKISSINELNAWLLSELNRLTGGHYENMKFFNENGSYTGALRLFGPALPHVVKRIKRIYPKGLTLPGLRSANRIYVPGYFRVKFLSYKAHIAVINSEIASYMNLKSPSYYIKVNGFGLRLYFSRDVEGPRCASNYNIFPCNGKSQLVVNLGSMILPAGLTRKISGYDVNEKIPDTPDEAINMAIKNGAMHPNFSIPPPPSELRALRIRGLEFSFSPSIYSYLAGSGITASFKDGRMVVTDEALGPVIEAYLDGKLEGVRMANVSLGSIEIIEQKDSEVDINRYHGIIPVQGDKISHVSLRYCLACNRSTPFRRCEACGSKTVKLYFCKKCGKPTIEKTCPICGSPAGPMPEGDVSLSESLQLAGKMLNLDPKFELSFPARSGGEVEDIRKAILRRRASIMASECGISAFQARAEAADIDPGQVIIPYRLASSLMDVARFIDAEMEQIYSGRKAFSAYSPEGLIGHNVILLNGNLSAGIRLRVKEIGSALLVNPGVLNMLSMSPKSNMIYVSLEEDVILNYSGQYCSPPKYLNIYPPGNGLTLPRIRLEYASSSLNENIVDMVKSLIDLIVSLNDKKGSIIPLVQTLIALENAYNTQLYICNKCGARFSIPPVSLTCTRCGAKLSPEIDAKGLNAVIISLRNLVEKLDENEREEVELILERLQGAFKSQSQLSLTEFS